MVLALGLSAGYAVSKPKGRAGSAAAFKAASGAKAGL